MIQTASPLRYPGGKSSLYDFTQAIIQCNGLERGHYIEPFAGGCGLALRLLFGGDVSVLHINDIDPGIWSFWHSVLNDTENFITLINDTNVTMEEWHNQKKIVDGDHVDDALKLGFATFFLNRTNRSGIIKGAGAIGGKNQTGNYKLDCRFNKGNLISRIKRIAKYKKSINLYNQDAKQFISEIQTTVPQKTLFCIDPPYYKKGPSLYTSFYKPEDHQSLSETVKGIKNPWIVTYDNVDEISALYRDNKQYSFDIQYSLQTKRKGSELLITSPTLRLPIFMEQREVA